MADVLPAIRAYLEDLAAGSVVPREKPTALQHGLLTAAATEIERLREIEEWAHRAGALDGERRLKKELQKGDSDG